MRSAARRDRPPPAGGRRAAFRPLGLDHAAFVETPQRAGGRRERRRRRPRAAARRGRHSRGSTRRHPRPGPARRPIGGERFARCSQRLAGAPHGADPHRGQRPADLRPTARARLGRRRSRCSLPTSHSRIAREDGSEVLHGAESTCAPRRARADDPREGVAACGRQPPCQAPKPEGRGARAVAWIRDAALASVRAGESPRTDRRLRRRGRRRPRLATGARRRTTPSALERDATRASAGLETATRTIVESAARFVATTPFDLPSEPAATRGSIHRPHARTTERRARDAAEPRPVEGCGRAMSRLRGCVVG